MAPVCGLAGGRLRHVDAPLSALVCDFRRRRSRGLDYGAVVAGGAARSRVTAVRRGFRFTSSCLASPPALPPTRHIEPTGKKRRSETGAAGPESREALPLTNGLPERPDPRPDERR